MHRYFRDVWDRTRFFVRLFNIIGVSRPSDFVEFLYSENRDIRWDAADLLSGFGDETVVEPVFEILLKEPDGMVAKKLVWTLEKGQAWDKIFSLIDFPRKGVRGYAASVLASSGQRQFVIPLLERMHEHETNDHAYYFDCWLALHGIVDVNSVEPILNLLSRTSSPIMKGDLFHLLGYTKSPQVFDLLVTELDTNDEKFRSKVVSGLVALGREDPRVVDMLHQLLSDPSDQIKVQARVAIDYWEKSATA